MDSNILNQDIQQLLDYFSKTLYKASRIDDNTTLVRNFPIIHFPYFHFNPIIWPHLLQIIKNLP